MDIKNIIQNQKKLDFIFDLDNTCISASSINLEHYKTIKEKYKELKDNKTSKLIDFIYHNKHLYYYLIIRNELFEFLTYAKQFCNFHISTLGYESYGKEIQKILENDFKLNLINFRQEVK